MVKLGSRLVAWVTAESHGVVTYWGGTDTTDGHGARLWPGTTLFSGAVEHHQAVQHLCPASASWCHIGGLLVWESTDRTLVHGLPGHICMCTTLFALILLTSFHPDKNFTQFSHGFHPLEVFQIYKLYFYFILLTWLRSI